jgi:hypothetical protein
MGTKKVNGRSSTVGHTYLKMDFECRNVKRDQKFFIFLQDRAFNLSAADQSAKRTQFIT